MPDKSYCFVCRVVRIVDGRDVVDAMYLDFRKACNRIDHSLLDENKPCEMF